MNNEEINFEHKIEQAQKLLEQLVQPDITLSQSVKVYKEGLQTINEAQKMLDDAKLEFEELMREE